MTADDRPLHELSDAELVANLEPILRTAMAAAWDEGYRLGTGDEALSRDWTDGEVRPARINPYREETT